MSGATTWCVVYNGGENPQVVSEEGKTVYPRDWACARRSYVQNLIDNGYLVIVDMASIGEDSSNAARLAKQEAETLNGQIDAAKEPTPSARSTKISKSNQ